MNQRVITRQQTKERHKDMQCKSYLLKIDKSHLSKKVKNQLGLLFLEARWFTNHAIANGVFDVDYKIKTVSVKTGDTFQDRNITALSSQMRQSLVDKLKQDIKNLSIKKDNGYKVGKLKFKSFIKTIPLKQFGVTYNICSKNHIKIQNIDRKLRARGLKQISKDAEYANAYLIQDHGDYYIRVVTYQQSEKYENGKDKAVGMDLGMRNQMVFSNGVSVQYRVPITKGLKKLYRDFSKTEKGSNNRYKARLKIQKGFYKLNNLKADIKNKIVSYLKNNYQVVCYQEDDIKEWQRIWGRKVMDTAIGGIKDILKERISTPVRMSKGFPSTYLCQCGSFNLTPLSEKIYSCVDCGYTMHRDVKAAISILYEGLNWLPAERREAALSNQGRQACGEESSTLAMLEYLNDIPRVKARLLYETGSLNALA